MPRNLLTTVGQSTVDNLVADNLITQKRIAVQLTEPGEYRRGQLLVLSADGTVATIPGEAADRIDCVLLDDVGTIELPEQPEPPADPIPPEPVPAAVALTGEFNRNAVFWGEIPEASQDAIIRSAWDRQLHLVAMHKAPYIQFGEV